MWSVVNLVQVASYHTEDATCNRNIPCLHEPSQSLQTLQENPTDHSRVTALRTDVSDEFRYDFSIRILVHQILQSFTEAAMVATP